jgi:hypothetical protein
VGLGVCILGNWALLVGWPPLRVAGAQVVV